MRPPLVLSIPVPADAPRLVEEFLTVTERMPRERAAGLAGVSIPTLQRWTRQSPRILRPPVRARIVEFLVGASPDGVF